MQNGVLQSPPGTGRSSLGIATDGTLTTGRVSFAGIWQGKAIRRPLLLNSPAGSGKFALYTPVYGGATPRERGVVEAVIGKLPAARLETPLDGTVTQVTTSGPIADPARRRSARRPRRTVHRPAQGGGAGRAAGRGLALALAGLARSRERDRWRPAAREEGQADLPRGRVLRGRPAQQPPGARSDRPALRRAHRPRRCRGAQSRLQHRHVELRARRRAHPARGDDRLRARRRIRLGNRVRRQAADTALEPRCPEGLRRARPLVQRRLRGASVEPVLSPNGDGVADTEAFSYRVVRPSDVVATLSGPGGAKVTLRSGVESRGLYTVGWNGTAGGSPAPEGTWTFTVTGTDDRKVTTTAQRAFSLDDTLSSLALDARQPRAPDRDVQAVARGDGPRAGPAAERHRGGDAALGAAAGGDGAGDLERPDPPSPGARRALPGRRAGDELHRDELARGTVLNAQASLVSGRCSSRASRRASPPR